MWVKFVGLFKVFVLSAIILSAASCNEKKTTVKPAEISFKKEGTLNVYKTTSDSTQVTFDIEIANNEYEIQTGLMYRNSLKDSQGMLFVFDDARERFFYMKNTKIPLDLIFIGANKNIVSFQKNAKPLDENSLPSNVPAKYVLEINAGLIEKWQIQVGDSLSFTE
ncbi:MAG: hypothetical protein COZ17_00165 [Flavobacteriaceae bacterium CG_4_10_14_3_um_filter_33_47]|nr:MAG: hypothetical protein COZ17_00165 [Flavobacteriaceae bacterium CG_4_10_14_3_um_filter_33_47]